MIIGLYIAATGMVDQMSRMDVISNNLANMNTTAFKKDYNVSRSFRDIMINATEYNNGMTKSPNIGSINFGVMSGGTYTDMISGGLKKTDDPFDIAINGNGYFVVQNGNTVAYTRDGHFARNQNGLLVTSEGMPVQGQRGNIILPQGNLSVRANGDIYVNGRYIDTLRIVDIAQNNVNTVRKIGNNMLTGTIGYRPIGSVMQGYLELSNVNPITEMVDMISVTRAYEANQKVITAMDDSLNKAVNDLGRI